MKVWLYLLICSILSCSDATKSKNNEVKHKKSSEGCAQCLPQTEQVQSEIKKESKLENGER